MSLPLTRFWFEFQSDGNIELPSGLKLGCGVTAFNIEDAKSILRSKIFNGEIPEIRVKKENIDVRTLDQNHVVTNMKYPTTRGVWFPVGY